MPIYESNGKRYSIPEDKVNDFLKAREGAKLVDETPFYLSNQQPQGVSKPAVKQPQQPNVTVQEEPQESTIDMSNLFSKHVARGNAFDNVEGGISLRDTAKVGHLGRSNNQGGIPDAMKDAYQNYKSGEQFKSSIQDQLEAYRIDNQGKLQDRYKDLQAREQEYERTKSGFQKLATAGSARMSDRALIQLDEDYSNYKFASDYINEAQQLISNVQDEKGILKGVGDAIFDYDTWILGIENTRKNAYTNTAIQKLERGEELTDSENALLDAMALNLAASAYYGSDLKRQYNWGQIAGESLPFMMEFILNPFAKMGKGVGKAIAKYGIKRFGKKGAGALATRVGGSLASDIVGASAMVGTTGLPRTFGDAASRHSGDAYYDVDEEGKIVFGGTEGAVDPLEAITNAFLSQGIEYFSEMTGERFSEVGRLIGRSPALKGIKATGFGRAMTKFNRSPVVRELRGLEKRGQWSGLIGEWYEERVGTMLNSLFVGDSHLSDLYDLEQQVDTFMGLSLTGGLMGGIRTTGYAADRAQSAKKLRRTDRTASSLFPNWDKMKSQIEGMTLAERKASILDIAISKDIPGPAKAAYTDYVGAKNYQDVLSGIKEESNKEELIDTRQRINQLVNTAVNPQTNSIIIANVPGAKEVRLYGDIVLNEDGTINEIDSGSVFYTAEDGKRHVVSPKFVEILENTPADQAKEETLNIVTEEIANRQANEAVRPYEIGEVVTFSTDGKTSLLGQVSGQNKDGTYHIAVDGMPEPLAIEPRMIIPEDNIRGIENGMQVQYRDQEGNIHTGIVNDAFGLRQQGLIDIDGNMVPTTDIIPIDEMTDIEAENEASPIAEADNMQAEVEETEQNDTTPEQQAEIQAQLQAEQEKQAFMDSLPVFEKGKNQGEIDQSRMTPEQNVQYFEYTYGKEKALQAAEKQVDNLKKRLKSERTKLDNDPFNIKQNQKVEDIQTQLDAYSNYVNQEKQRLTEENIKSTPKSSIAEDRQARSEDIRQEEAGATGQADQSIIEKWSNAEKIEGIEDVITLSNGEKIEGRYVLTTADAPSPSHDIERNFAKTVGFPVNEQGNTVNDRDYEADLTAQTLVQQRANNYDERAVQTPVVVSQDGVVLSGNDRTMAGQIAAINGTDGAYTSYIERYANRWGFTPEQVQSVQNPRIVFVPNNPMPYNTATFAKFNAEEKKTQNSLEAAIKASKSISREVVIPLAETIENFDKLTDFYSSAPAIKKTIDALLQNGVIQPNELPRLMDGNLLSAEGKSFLETIMLGSVLGEQALREVDQMRSVRQTLMRTMPQLFRNSSLKEYSLMGELNNAIHLLYEAKQNGSTITLHLKQGNLFELSAEEVYSETEKLLSLMLEGEKDTTFRNIFEAFNKKAVSIESGQVDLFDGIMEKPDLLKQILEIYGQQETESSEQAESPDGIDSRSEERREEQRPEEQSTDEGTGQQQEVEEPDSYIQKTVNRWVDLYEKGEYEEIFDDVVFNNVDANRPYIKPFEERVGITIPDISTKKKKRDFIKSLREKPIINIVEHANNVVKNEEIRVEADKTDTKPSEAQKKAGNYRKGHVNIQGFDITIENPAGSVRSGVNQDGTEWSNTMQNHYGYFKRTNGKDGDQIDVFVGNKPESNHIFVVDQINTETKEFDESKVMLGFDTLQEAKDAYLSNYEEGWQGLGSITTVDVDTFKEWAKDRKSQRKPFSEYRDVQSKQVPKEYGAENKGVTTEQYEELKQRMRGLLNNLNVGFNPEIFTIGAQMAAYHMEAGARKFADYATRMINDLGENVKPYLKSFYEGVRAMGNEYEGMDSYKYVKDFDVESLGKEVQKKTEEKQTDNKKDDVPLRKGPQQGSLFDNVNTEEDGSRQQTNTRADNRQSESDRGRLPESEQVPEQGVSSEDASRTGESERMLTESGSGQPRTRHEHDVSREYSNEEIHGIVSSVTEIKDGKVEITGEITDDIKTIAGRYKSGGVAKEGRGVLDEYYTSERIVDAVAEILSKYIKPNTNTRALEPSVGIGNFIDALPNKGEIVSFEINETTARIAKILHPNIEVNLRPFETEFIDEKGNKKPMPSKYDIVVGNPPYGQHRGKYKGLGEESRISRYEDYFVKRGLDVLNENGILAMVLPSGWMNRNKLENGYRILDAYRLPTGVFEGTDIGTDIVVLQKDSKHKSKENHNYFDSNPANILGETKERKNRFGRMEEYVDGDIDSAMDALRQNEAKKIASDLHIEPTRDNVNEIDEAVKEATTSDGAKKVVRATRAKKSTATAPESGKIVITPSQLKYEFKRGDEVVPAADQFPNKFSKEESDAFRDTDYSGVFKNPEKHRRYANYYAGKWMHDFYYAEGNIYDRLEQLERDRDNISKEQYDKQRQMLQDVLPDQKTLGEININPNTAFVKNLNLPSSESEKKSLQDRFLEFAGNLPRDAFGSSNYWEVRSYVLNEQVYGQDKARNQLVRERRKRVGKDLFHKFLREELTDTQRKQVEYAFNREYNAVYRPDYAKVPMFSSIHKNFRGKPFELTEVQKAGIGRMTVKGVGVLAHEVGFGKTLSAILSMHEAMDRGYTKKPLIVVPNDSILKQWVETINDILPEATVNVLGNLGVKYNLDNFNVNDGEYTIVTYQGFKKLSFRNNVYDKLAQDFHYISDTDLDKQKSTRESEKEKADIQETVGKMQRQGSYSFEDAGFDYLTFDEIHNANHIVGKVQIDRKDHSDFRSQSQNTSDLGIKTWVAAQYIQQQNDGRNVLLLSATPFTNKPLEYYSILSLVANSTLKRMGFYQVDQFFETFMEADNDLEIAANGKAQQKTNVRRFRNNGLFNQLLGEYIDIKGEQDNPDLVRPERINKEYKIPQNNLTQDALAQAQALLEDGETVLSGLTQSRLIAFSPYASYLSNESPQSHKEFVENSPKIHGTIKLIEQNRKDNAGAGQIVYSELGVDFFPYIRDYLINESKFKASEVAIIAGSTSATERTRIQSEFNKGAIKVILGSPAIKEGMNLQENTTDMYILSLPYNFTQLRQVEGRGWRQGNTWQNIRVNYMLTNDSVDIFMLQRLQIKQGLYNEAMRQGAETIDVSDINTEELKNALITNPETRADLEITVERNRLEAEKERINADLAFILRKHKKFNELRSTVDQKRESVRNYEKNAEKDSWWNGYVEREKRNLLKYENDLQEEKLNIEKKGVNVDDIDNQIEKSNAQIQSLDNEIEGLKDEYTKLVDKYRKEREELSKESGNLLESHLQERANENKGGFYEKRDNTLFRSNDSREAYAEREWNRAKNAANEIASRLGVEIDILETTDGLTGKKAEAKGWYDPETGKIVIVMPNHRSSGDVQATLLHETVGHHGLRELFGEHFDTFLDNVFNNADEGIQRAIRNIEKEQRLDRRTATEEYLSWLAEDGSLLEGDGMRSWFGKVKQFFLDMLAKVGINLDFRLSDNELRYILWRSYQNLANPGRYKTPSDQARDSAMQSELKVGSFAEVEHIENEVADLRFRMTQPPRNVSEAAEAANSSMTEQLRQEYDRKYSKFATRFREAWEDMYLPVKQFLDVLRGNGIEVAEYNDFYKQATALSGKNDAQLDHFRKAFQKPITEQISNLEKLGFEYRDIENYVFAKHGLERNDFMAKQEARDRYAKDIQDLQKDYKDGKIGEEELEMGIDAINLQIEDRYEHLLETKDYSGITALEEEFDKTAEEYITEFEQKAEEENIAKLWDAIKKATDYTLERQYKSGMIKKETLDELRSRYDNYVPLRGHDETTAEDRWDYTPDMGTYFSAPLLKAHGRRSRAESPFAYIEQMAHSAITWGNKNDLKQTMLRLARTDTKGLMSASQTWYRNMGTKEDPRWEQVSAEYNENVDQYLQNQRDFEEQMRELHAEGMAFQSGARKLDIGGIFIKPKQAEQHELRVYQNGTSYTVYINANPAVAQAINGSNRKDKSKSLGAFSTVTRNMAANFTTRNPLFVMTNLSRDYIFASSILTVKESPAYAVKFQRNIPNAMGSLQRYVRGKLDMTNPNDVMMYEYIMNGAKTGFSSIFELDRVAKKLKREAEKGNKKKSALDYGRNVLDVVDSLNEIAENMSRLSVYITSRKEGRSITQSVHDAKNVTVNFNQKGAGRSAAKNRFEAFIFNASSYVRPLYLFSNAAIQSLSNFSKVAVKNPKGMSALVASYALSGFIAPFLAGLIGGDDGKEDYMKLSDWERQNNWCIWLPNGFVKIPLPHELRVFHRMGDNIYQAAFENRDIFQTLLDVSMGFSDLLPVNPLGATDASWAELAPDAIRPFVQLVPNTNFMGSRIYDKWARKHAPGYQKVRTNKKGEPYAPKALIGISKWIDNTTGGDGVKKGVISPPNPDIVHHLARGYFGGLYTLAEQGINIIAQAYSWTQTGDLDLKIRQTPLRTFYADANDLNIQGSGLNSRYWKVTDDILKSRGLIKGYSDQLVNGEITHDAFQEKIKGLNVPLVNEINDYIKTIRKYENALKEMNSDEQKEAERIISDLKKTVIELGNGI